MGVWRGRRAGAGRGGDGLEWGKGGAAHEADIFLPEHVLLSVIAAVVSEHLEPSHVSGDQSVTHLYKSVSGKHIPEDGTRWLPDVENFRPECEALPVELSIDASVGLEGYYKRTQSDNHANMDRRIILSTSAVEH